MVIAIGLARAGVRIPPPSTWFLLAVLVSAWWGGFVPGILAGVITIAITLRFMPRVTLAQLDVGRIVLLSLLSLLTSWARWSRLRSEAQLREAALNLEQRVAERTQEIARNERNLHEQVEALREQAQLLDLARDAIIVLAPDQKVHLWYKGAEELYGWTREEASGRLLHDLLQSEWRNGDTPTKAQLLALGMWEGEVIHTTKSGSRITVSSRWVLRRDERGEASGYLVINRDVTENKRLEDQLRHRQKLESLGVMAGGIAHDFNNLLTGILGHASLACEELPKESPARSMMEQILNAGERASDLTRQLLAYTGKGRFVIKRINLSGLIEEIAPLLHTSIPKSVELNLDLDSQLPPVMADSGQIQQVIMNLIINGAEAIPVGKPGSVFVHTRMQLVDENCARQDFEVGQISPGVYAVVEVRDTGSGMDEETKAKIFDPFFTTKFTGRGLGLAAVQGIVNSHKGAMRLHSRPGEGATFQVFLPAAAQEVSAQVELAKGD